MWRLIVVMEQATSYVRRREMQERVVRRRWLRGNLPHLGRAAIIAGVAQSQGDLFCSGIVGGEDGGSVVDDPIGAAVEQFLVGSRGAKRQNARARRFSGAHAGRRVFDHHAILRSDAQFGRAFLVGFGIGFAAGDVAGGDQLADKREQPGRAMTSATSAISLRSIHSFSALWNSAVACGRSSRMVERLGRPWALSTMESASKPNFAAQRPQTRATAGVESTSTPSMSRSRPRQRIVFMRQEF